MDTDRGPQAPSAHAPGTPAQAAFRKRELALSILGTLIPYFSLFSVPIAGFFLAVLTPLPTILSVYRFGPPLGYRTPACALALSVPLLFALGLPSHVGYLLGLLILGACLAEGMRRRWSVERTIGWGGMAAFAVFWLIFWAVNDGGSGRFFARLDAELQQSIAAALSYYEQMGMSFDRPSMQRALEHYAPVFVRLLPGAVCGVTLLLAWVNTLLAKRFCLAHRVPLPQWPPLDRWRAPDVLVWPLIAGGFLLLTPSTELSLVGGNVIILCGIIYLLQGLAIVVYYCEIWRLPKVLRGLLYAMLMLQQFATLLLAVVGLFDTWLNFRRLPGPETPPPREAR